jgi:hypothetical protein
MCAAAVEPRSFKIIDGNLVLVVSGVSEEGAPKTLAFRGLSGSVGFDPGRGTFCVQDLHATGTMGPSDVGFCQSGACGMFWMETTAMGHVKYGVGKLLAAAPFGKKK